MAMIFFMGKGYRAQSERETVHRVNSTDPLPMESYRTHLISSAMNCDKACELLPTRKIH